jgi:hypothetical protein
LPPAESFHPLLEQGNPYLFAWVYHFSSCFGIVHCGLVPKLQRVSIREGEWWRAVQMMTGSYQSRKFEELNGADGVFKADREARDRMLAAANPGSFRKAMRRLLPWPCAKRYTIVTTVQATVLHTLVAVASQCAPWLVGALMLGALWMWHGRRVSK